MAQHVAIRREEYVAGTSDRPEVGVFTQTHATRPPVPWNQIAIGETVWMKWSGGPIVAQAQVEGFRQIENCTPKKLRDTTKGFQLYDLEEYWATRHPSFFGMSIYIKEQRWLDKLIEPGARSRGASWIVLRTKEQAKPKAISQLNHPHICTLYDVGEQDGIDFIVMEYIEGETLAERLKKGALPLDEALEYGIQIADGLDTAHRAGIVHRDLKPAKAMLTKSGIKLLDFGLAKVLAVETGPETSDAPTPTRHKDLTKEQAIIGTLQYMAPEQLEGESADTRTNIFAFGAVLYEMVTGGKAFEGRSQASLISAIMTSEPPAMASLQTMTPPMLDHVVTRCLAKDADERWQSATDLMQELKWVADGGPGAAVSVGVVPARTKRERLTWSGVVLALAGVSVWSRGCAAHPLPLARSPGWLSLFPTTSGSRFAFSCAADGFVSGWRAADLLGYER